ncbi:MAG TPA: hypothetical protein VHT73_00005, partial [Thermodesulfobacteriota bacterium]|nr:hypothetical protein [Thermodesulfobacteriota bacterium]
GAVDKYLVKNNRLILLEDIESIRRKILLRKREMTNSFKNVKRPALQEILKHIMSILQKEGR